MTDALATLDLSDLSTVSGGFDAKVDVKVDANELVRDAGSGAGRLLGCAAGASSMREFGNCILTGKLGDTPPPPPPPQSTRE